MSTLSFSGSRFCGCLLRLYIVQFVSSNLSSKILKEALEQQQEIEQEEASENKRSEITPSFGLDSGDFDKYEDDDENDSDGGVSEACTQFNGDVRHLVLH